MIPGCQVPRLWSQCDPVHRWDPGWTSWPNRAADRSVVSQLIIRMHCSESRRSCEYRLWLILSPSSSIFCLLYLLRYICYTTVILYISYMCVFKLSYVALGILQIYSIHIFFFRTIPSLVNSNPHCKTPRWRWKDRWSQQTSAGGGDSQDQGRPMCAETWLLSSTTCSRRVAITYLKSAQNYMLIGYVQEKVWISSGLGQDCDRIWAEHPAHTSRFGCQKLSCYVGELAATIGEGSTYLLWLKLFIWPNSILKWFTFCTFRRFCGIWC